MTPRLCLISTVVPLLLALTADASLADTEPADAAPAAACIDDIEAEGRNLVFEIDWVLEQRRMTTSARFAALREKRNALLTFEHGDRVRDCLTAHPQHTERVAQWLERFGRPALDRAQNRLDEICIGEAELLILSKKREIERAMSRNRLADAASAADELENGLAQEIIHDCPVVKKRVDELLAEFIPDVRRAVALPTVRADMRAAYEFVAATLAPTRKALATGGKTIAEAPPHLATADGQQALLTEVLACLRHAEALRSLGAKRDMPLGEPTSADRPATKLADAEALCKRTAENIDAMFEQIEVHNDAYHAEQRRKWEYVNIKGWGMQKIYNRLGRPTETVFSTSNDTIEWTYRGVPKTGKCTSYQFTMRGKQIKRKRARCPDAVAQRDR